MENEVVNTETVSTPAPTETTTPAPEPKVEAKAEAKPKSDKKVHQKGEPVERVSAKDFYSNIKKEKGFVDKRTERHGDSEAVDGGGDGVTPLDLDGKEKPAVESDSKDQFSPSYKYKVKDKEFDVPEWARPFITSKEAEKNFTDLFTKAEGIEAIKESRTQVEQRAVQAETRVQGMETYVKDVLSLRDKGLQGDYRSMDKFYKHMKISDRDVVAHAQKILERNELPPDQKELYDRTNATQDALDERETQFQEMQSMMRETNAKAKSVDLQLALAKADHQKYADNYDSMNGTPGSFRQQVIDYGKYVFLTTGRDLSAEESINELKAKLGKGYIPQEKPATTQTEAQVTQPQAKKELPVIPNVTGRNVSHVTKQVRTTADLRKLAKEKFA